MAKDEKRLNINGLVPSEKYAIQVRAVDGGEASKWSQKYHVLTIDDTAGGTRLPQPPALKEWKVDASGQYIAVWDSVTHYSDNTPVVVSYYELELVGGTTVIVQHFGQRAGEQVRAFNFGSIRGYFGGLIPTTIQCRMRVINSAGTPSEWTEPLTASLPVPNPPKNVIGAPATDAIKLTWEPPDDPTHLFGYRVYLGYDAGFVPDTLGRSNLAYQGPALEFTYGTASYLVDHFFKVVSYSEPGLESTSVDPVPTPLRPKNPYGPDDIPPDVPVLNSTVTMNSTRTSAELAWTFDKTTEKNEDISGFVVAYQMSGETNWRNAYFSAEAAGPGYTGLIDIPRPFANYKFKIAAYDFVGNYSAYSSEVTLAGTVAPPEQTVGVQAAAGLDNLRVTWAASTSESVLSGGSYQVQFRASNSFPSDTPIEYTTRDPFIQISGLVVNTPYWFRVRAVDSALQVGPWSSVATKSTNNFPVDPTSDGQAPTTAPTSPKATGGLNYVNVSWNTVPNDDATWYEIHMSTTDDFTPSGATKVAEAWGTSAVVNTTPAGTPLAQGTVYYFKVVARDKDGLGPYSAQTSASLTQVATADLGINMSGENLLFNSSFEADSDSNGVADYWQVVNNSAGPNPATASLVAGRTLGLAQKVSWTGVNGANLKGLKSLNSSQLRPNTEYVYSFYARADAGTAFSLTLTPASASSIAMSNPVPDATTWQRYIFWFMTGASVDADNGTLSIVGHGANGGWFEIDDAQLESGNLASAYKTGTVSFAKLTSGRMSTAELIVDAQGIVKSTDYNTTNKTGWGIHNGGIDVFKGRVNAATLEANTTITQDLYVGSKLTVANNGYIQNAGYSDGSVTAAAGYRITKDIIDIRSGIVAVGTLIGGTISAAEIKLGVNAKMIVDSASASIQSNNWNITGGPAGGPLGFKIDNSGITMDGNSKINVNALETGTLNSTTLTIGSGGVIQSSGWATSQPVRWQIAENALTMVGGTITGATVITDQLYSAQSETMNGVLRRKFSINAQGYAELSGAYIYGNVVVGNGDQHFIQSANYAGSGTGWKIFGNGGADFKSASMKDLTVYGTATVGAGWASGEMRSTSYSAGSSGWRIAGDGSAEFNNGDFKVGSYNGAAVRLLNVSAGATLGPQLRLVQPGEDSAGKFSIMIARNGALEIAGSNGGTAYWRGPWAGGSGSSHISLGPDVEVRKQLVVQEGITVETGGMTLKSGGGLNLNGGGSLSVSGTLSVGGNSFLSAINSSGISTPNGGGKRELLIDANNWFIGGAQRGSTIRIKKNVKNFVYSKEQVLSLRPVRYNLKDEFWYEDSTGINSFSGVIAEEAAEIGLEDFVMRDEEGLPDDFDYPRFTSALLFVAREQQKEIDELKKLVRKALDK